MLFKGFLPKINKWFLLIQITSFYFSVCGLEKLKLQQLINYLSTIKSISNYFDNQLIGFEKYYMTKQYKISDSSILYLNIS